MNINMDTPRTGIPSQKFKDNWDEIFGKPGAKPKVDPEPTMEDLKQRIASLEAEIESLLGNI